MKRILLGIWMVMWGTLGMVNAQSYEKLWKQVEDYEKRGLPQSAAEASMSIYSKAEKEKYVPQMMKAYLTAMSFRGEISPDSIGVDIKGLEEWAASEPKTEYKAVLYSILGEWIIDKDFEKGNRFIKRSLADSTALQNFSVKKMIPLAQSGETSRRYFKDNLYDLLARRAINSLKTQRWGQNRQKVWGEIEEIYQSLLRFYKEKKNREAWLLTALESSDCTEEQLRLWIKEYGDLDVCAEVYAKLADYRYLKDNYVEQLALLREGISKYSKYERLNILKVKEQNILEPQLYYRISNGSLYPEREMTIEVRHKNLSGFTLQIYKLNLSADSVALDSVNCKNVDRYGKLFRTLHFDLKPTLDYKQITSYLTTVAPPTGIYYFKVLSDSSVVNTGQVVHVSKLNIIHRELSEGHHEFAIVDKMTGHPVDEAELLFYRRKNGKYSLYHTYYSHNKCVVRIKGLKRDKINLRAKTSSDDAMKIELSRLSYYKHKPDTIKKEKIVCFTDRAIYRPGQTVCFSGIVYDQRMDSTAVADGRKIKAWVISAVDGKSLVELDLESDEFGTFSGKYSLPSDVLPGIYILKANGGRINFRVEEYKRSTFDVKFDSIKTAYHAGDTLYVTGMARTFSNVPVANAKVKYVVSRNYAPRWYNSNVSNNYRVEGEMSTDDEGRYMIPVYLIPEKETGKNECWVYHISAQITDLAGETQEEILKVPLGSSSLMIRISSEWKGTHIYKRFRKPLEFEVVNLNDVPVKALVDYRVYEWKKGEKDEDVTGKLLYSSMALSNQSFMPDSLYNLLPSGKYILKAAVKDERGKMCEVSTTFALFTKMDKGMPYETPLLAYCSSYEFEGDKPVYIIIGSSEEDVYLYSSLQYGNIEKSKVGRISNSMIGLCLRYKEEYGDGVNFSYAFFKKGELYEGNFFIKKPLPDKRLQLKWITFRDRLYPGQQEEWKLCVTKDGKPIGANLLVGMYDASLDKFREHQWRMNLRFNRFLRSAQWVKWNITNYRIDLPFPLKTFTINPFSFSSFDLPNSRMGALRGSGNGVVKSKALVANNMSLSKGGDDVEEQQYFYSDGGLVTMDNRSVASIRSNFAETAFFYPNLRTDANGEVSISFTLPESLTTWKFMGLAHTKDMDYGQITAEAVASKEFMLQPNMPRFVRVGDEVSLSASLINMSDKDVIGNVRMELFNPKDDKVYLTKKQRFLVTPNATTTVHFGFEVKEVYEDLAVRWIAEGDNFSDGEQRPLPVLSNRQWITESVPLYINGEGTKVFSLETLFNHHSKSVSNPKMTVEFTGNPGWYAVQALPMLANPQNEDALSWATAFYAHSLTRYLAETNPGIVSELDVDTLGFRASKVLNKLQELQNSDGSWSWYKGMDGNRFITTQVAELFARLMAVPNDKVQNQQLSLMWGKAMDYLGEEAKKEYNRMKEAEKEGGKNLCPSEQVLHYLYICAISQPSVDEAINGYFIDKLVQLEQLGQLTIYGKAQGAVILQKAGKEAKAKEFLQSVMEYSVYTDELGRYFDTPRAEYSWRSYKIPTQVTAIEAIHRVANEGKTVEEMKRWLLQQKRVQDWDSPIATTDAVYALLGIGENVLANTGECELRLGKTDIYVTKNDTLAYVKQTIEDKVTDIGEVTVKKRSPGMGWGAVYAEYQEEMDKIGTQGNALRVQKQIYRDGRPLVADETLKVGDKLSVRLTVKADRDMDFIEVKDERAACMEPVDVLSNYRWKDGAGYFQRTKDSSTSFYLEKMRKGTYMLQYEVYVNMAGTYQSGAASVCSVYAPEFNGHTGGLSLSVED